MADGFVSVSRRIEVPAERLFALLADSTNHPLIDGSGMVRQSAPGVVVSGVGDAFLMDMHHDRFGYYQMRNEIIEFEDGRRLVWEPVRVADPDDGDDAPEPGRYRWGFDIAPDGPDAAMVTESFDCTRSGPELRDAVNEGEGWRDAMTASLVKLELLARAMDHA
ncbi:MAG TPA: SRPBCC family protein [Trebonia sp.]|jgi:hypothetical protein|nr:SRPBCC family protein [Trebonia sp.]